YADFGTALEFLRRSRGQTPPADSIRVSMEVDQHRVYSSFIELGSRLYRETGRRRFAEETFAASEEGRAARLRALWVASDVTNKLPVENWQTMADLQRVEAALVRNDPDADADAGKRARVKLAEMEMNAGLEGPADSVEEAAARLLAVTQAALGADEVYIGFHL